MAAREVMAEDAWRVQGRKLKPADLAEIDRIAVETGTATTVREQVEDFCGEPLADTPSSWQTKDHSPPSPWESHGDEVAYL